MKKRKYIDIFSKITTYFFSSFGVIILISIMTYVFINGVPNLSWKLLTSDYQETTYNIKSNENISLQPINYEPKENEFFSAKWGIALMDSEDVSGNSVVEISYIDTASPFNSMIDIATSTEFSITEGLYIDKIVLSDEENSYYALSKSGAEDMITKLDKGTRIDDMIVKKGGGGIRSSIIVTILLILLTLLISLPLGIGSAIYLNEYAPNNKFIDFINASIDMIGGIPSIIFGFFGMFVFIPFCNFAFATKGGSILSGSLTLSVMLLPTIIKTVKESLQVLPDSFRNASLALGASKVQTIFKVILPNSISGILTATVLSIGRIIGESASLIFALGTVIKDQVSLSGNGTSLAVHIWVLMGGEKPNFATSCSIAIVILMIVLLLNLMIKIIERKLNKYGK